MAKSADISQAERLLRWLADNQGRKSWLSKSQAERLEHAAAALGMPVPGVARLLGAYPILKELLVVEWSPGRIGGGNAARLAHLIADQLPAGWSDIPQRVGAGVARRTAKLTPKSIRKILDQNPLSAKALLESSRTKRRRRRPTAALVLTLFDDLTDEEQRYVLRELVKRG